MSKREKRFQDKAIAYLRKQGVYYINVYGSGRSAKGAPDLIACINGKFIAFELKVGSNRLQDDQIIHKRKILRSGGLHFAPYTMEEFISIVKGELERGRL